MEKKIDTIDRLVSQWNQEQPELDVDAMHVVGRIIKLGNVFEKRATKVLKGSGINYTDLDVLATIRRSGKPYELTPKQLMESVLITSGAMTALLNRLTRLELIYRALDSQDGRVKLAGLTNEGIKTIDKAIKLRFDEAKNAIDIFSENEILELSALLKKLCFSLANTHN